MNGANADETSGGSAETAPPELVAAARAWLAQDPDPDTRDELSELIERTDDGDEAATADLRSRFGARLAFGTAGLRGELGAGPNRMNRVLVAQAAAGLAAYLNERVGSGRRPSVVIGYDGRRNSDVFARDSAEVFAGAEVDAIVLPRMLPTPVLAFAVRHLDADAGVMVTASHNPPGDNGYKVYLGGDDDGAQIVPPADGLIADHISRLAASVAASEIPRSLGYRTAPENVVDAYIERTTTVATAPAGADGLRWVYTAMHGVGADTLGRVVAQAGFPAPIPVREQIEPDGAFPTVAFPNPEEPGAMDLAFATARDADAELVIANDPDADRLAVAVPDPEAEGGWRRLTGNQIGLLLGWRAARRAAAARDEATPDETDPVTHEETAGQHEETPPPAGHATAQHDTTAAPSLACSLVSSPGLAAVAEHYGLDAHATLTGFKWISRAPGLVFGFEEALGYLVNPETVRDKDGISAALAILELAGEARGEGRTVSDLLDESDRTFGHFASDQISMRVEDVSAIGRIMAALRESAPERVGKTRVTGIDDLLTGVDGLPPGDVLRLWLENGSRLIVRPSGTEPKLKLYLDVRAESAEEAQTRLAALSAGARALLDGIS